MLCQSGSLLKAVTSFVIIAIVSGLQQTVSGFNQRPNSPPYRTYSSRGGGYDVHPPDWTPPTYPSDHHAGGSSPTPPHTPYDSYGKPQGPYTGAPYGPYDPYGQPPTYGGRAPPFPGFGPAPGFISQPMVPVINVVPDSIYETKKPYRKGRCFDLTPEEAYPVIDQDIFCVAFPVWTYRNGFCDSVSTTDLGVSCAITNNKFISAADCKRNCEPECTPFFHQHDCSVYQKYNVTAIGYAISKASANCEPIEFHPGCPGLGQLFESEQDCITECFATNV